MKEIRIAIGNKKLGKIPNTSLVPGKDCGNCRQCIKDCYALKAYRQYPATKTAWESNSELWRLNPESAVNQVLDWFQSKRKPVPFFRIHVAGDFLDQSHVNDWIYVAVTQPDTRFLAFTKMHTLDFTVAPKNLAVIFSQWSDVPDEAPKGAPRAWCDDGGEIVDRIPKDAIVCPGYCEDCGMCWDIHKVGRDIVFPKH